MRLTKREIVLLVILAIIGLTFVEYKFLFAPGLATYSKLLSEEANLKSEVEAIRIKLVTKDAISKKRDENLARIAVLAAPYFDSLATDALLVSTHELMRKNNFALEQYGITQVRVVELTADQAEAVELSYLLKDLAEQYQALKNAEKPSTGSGGNQTGDQTGSPATATPTPAPTPAPTPGPADGGEKVAGDQAEILAFSIIAQGNYEQIRSLLTDIAAWQRTVIITSLMIEPDEGDMINMTLDLNFYGITKLETQSDPLNEWQRPPFNSGTGNPYGQMPEPVNVTPSPTPAPTPVVTPTPAITITPTPAVTVTPTPAASPTPQMTPQPTRKPTPKPTSKPAP